MLWTALEFKLLAHGLPWVGTAAFVLVNLAAAERRLASEGAWRRVAYPLAVVAAGVIASDWRSDEISRRIA